jgi:hypothetical protein
MKNEALNKFCISRLRPSDDTCQDIIANALKDRFSKVQQDLERLQFDRDKNSEINSAEDFSNSTGKSPISTSKNPPPLLR